MSMRIGGLASGIDTETIIKDLMKAERIPLDKMEQDKTKLEWQRDKFREINTLRLELDNMVSDMQFSSTYKTKTVSSSMESAVTATAGSGAPEGSYKIEVSNLASNEMQIHTISGGIDEDQALGLSQTFNFSTYNEAGAENETSPHSFTIDSTDSLNDVLDKITSASDGRVRAFYVKESEQIVLETNRTGIYNTNTNGNEIEFAEGSTFGELLMNDVDSISTTIKSAENASFSYNEGLELTSKDNNYTLNGITFQFNNTTDGSSTTLNVTNDVDATVEKITNFVDKYNELIKLLNDSQKEEIYRDYPPLTDEQKEGMDEKEIELWEEKAKSGILRGDSVISSALFDLRQGWYKTVNTGGSVDLITDIGISTTKNYLDGGQLEVDEEILREKLVEDSDSVYKLFAGSGETDGLTDHLDDTLTSFKEQIDQRAGRSTDTALTNYTLGKRIKDIDDRINAFQDRLTQTEDRYWRQFSAMEEAISMMNQQSSMLMSNFGGQ